MTTKKKAATKPKQPAAAQSGKTYTQEEYTAAVGSVLRVGECRGFAEGLQAAAAAFAEQLRTAPDACRMAKVSGMQWLSDTALYDAILELQPAPPQRPDRG